MNPTRFSYTPWWSSDPTPVPVSLEGYRDDDLIAYTIRTQRNFWELDLLEYVAMVGPRGGLFLDVGGNIGNHAAFFGLFCADHVATFEPHPDLVPILQRNLINNNLSHKSTLFPLALGAAESTGSMSIREGYEQNIGASHVTADASPIENQKSKIKNPAISIRPLDSIALDLARKLNLPITFLKIDVEGMELEVLRGATQTLRDHRPQLLVELITPESHAAASAILTPLGYREITRLSDPPSYHLIDPSRHTLRPNRWRGGTFHAHQVHMLEEDILSATPADAILIVADGDELGLGPTVAGRKRLPFTEQNGIYFGPPASNEQALSELTRLKSAGATHFVLAPPSFWYLDTFKTFTHYLRSTHAPALETSRAIIFPLA